MGPIVTLLVFGVLGSLVGGAALVVIEIGVAVGRRRERESHEREALERLAGRSPIER